MKRVLLILGVIVLVSGIGVAVARRFTKQSTSPDATAPPAVGGGALPGSGSREDAPSPAPAGTTPLSPACPDTWVGLPDTDADGLPDTAEALYHTDERTPDTDGDGHTDGEEVRAGYHPLKKQGNPTLDSDGDGLRDHEECQWKTELFVADTDGDGFPDGAEVTGGFDPTIRGDGRGSDAVPSRRAEQAEQTLEQLRPNPNAENYTEGLAGLITKDRPVRELGRTAVTPQQVQHILNQAQINTTLPSVSLTDIQVQPSNTADDVRAYLQRVDTLRPQDLGDATLVTNALTGALNGNTAGIRTLRARLAAYQQTLVGIPVPPSGVEYHRTLIALTRFVNDRFGEVEATAASDPARTYLALRALQEGLPNHIQALQLTRGALDSLLP